VGQFVNENAREFLAGAIERDAAFAEEGAAMDGASGIAKTARVLDADGVPEKLRQTAQDGLRPAFQGRIFKLESCGADC